MRDHNGDRKRVKWYAQSHNQLVLISFRDIRLLSFLLMYHYILSSINQPFFSCVFCKFFYFTYIFVTFLFQILSFSFLYILLLRRPYTLTFFFFSFSINKMCFCPVRHIVSKSYIWNARHSNAKKRRGVANLQLWSVILQRQLIW